MPESNSNIAANLDIVHRRGDTFIREFTFTNDDTPFDLTGWDALLQIRESASKPVVLQADMEGVSPFISIIGNDDNVLRIEIPAEQIEIPAKRYVWDLELTSPAGVKTTYLEGTFTLVQDITQPTA
jgi:hypothetical protein